MLGVQEANPVGSQTCSSVTGIVSRCGTLTSLLLSVRFLRSSQRESVTEWNYATVSFEHAANYAIGCVISGSVLCKGGQRVEPCLRMRFM